MIKKTVVQIKYEQSEKNFKNEHNIENCLQDVPGKALTIISDSEWAYKDCSCVKKKNIKNNYVYNNFSKGLFNKGFIDIDFISPNNLKFIKSSCSTEVGIYIKYNNIINRSILMSSITNKIAENKKVAALDFYNLLDHIKIEDNWGHFEKKNKIISQILNSDVLIINNIEAITNFSNNWIFSDVLNRIIQDFYFNKKPIYICSSFEIKDWAKKAWTYKNDSINSETKSDWFYKSSRFHINLFFEFLSQYYLNTKNFIYLDKQEELLYD